MTLAQAQAADREMSETLAVFEEARRRLCNLAELAHRENLVCQEIPLALANKAMDRPLRYLAEAPTFVGSVSS